VRVVSGQDNYKKKTKKTYLRVESGLPGLCIITSRGSPISTCLTEAARKVRRQGGGRESGREGVREGGSQGGSQGGREWRGETQEKTEDSESESMCEFRV
jgi:hypothetical protein